jgi:uncharacterized protein YneF (UPF0154 family)
MSNELLSEADIGKYVVQYYKELTTGPTIEEQIRTMFLYRQGLRLSTDRIKAILEDLGS